MMNKNANQNSYGMDTINPYLVFCQGRGVDPVFEFVLALADKSQTSVVLKDRRKPLTDGELECVCQILIQTTQIRSLDISGNECTVRGMASLGKVLSQNNVLSYVNVARNGIGDEGVSQLLDGSMRVRKLRHLDCSGSNITCKGLVSICRLLTENILESLICSHNKISDDGVSYLGKCLEKNFQCRKIILNNNNINDGGVQAVGNALKTNKALRELDLSGNNIGDAGMSSLATGIKFNSGLSILRLRFNGVGNVGAQSISSALSTGGKLEELYLGYNQLTLRGVSALFNMLKTNTTLRVLDVSGCLLREDDLRMVRASVQTNRRLERIYIDVEDSVQCGKILDELVGEASTLKKIHVNEPADETVDSGTAQGGAAAGGSAGTTRERGMGADSAMRKTVSSYSKQVSEMSSRVSSLETELLSEREKKRDLLQQIDSQSHQLLEKEREVAQGRDLQEKLVSRMDETSQGDKLALAETERKLHAAAEEIRKGEIEVDNLRREVEGERMKFEAERRKCTEMQERIDEERMELRKRAEGAGKQVGDLQFKIDLHAQELQQYRNQAERTQEALALKTREFEQIKGQLEKRLVSEERKGDDMKQFASSMTSQLRDARLEKEQVEEKLRKEHKFVAELQMRLDGEKRLCSELRESVKAEKMRNSELSLKVDRMKDEMYNYIEERMRRVRGESEVAIDGKIHGVWNKLSAFLKQFEEKIPQHVAQHVSDELSTKDLFRTKEVVVDSKTRESVDRLLPNVQTLEKELSQLRRYVQNNMRMGGSSGGGDLSEIESDVGMLKKKYLELVRDRGGGGTQEVERKFTKLVNEKISETKLEIQAIKSGVGDIVENYMRRVEQAMQRGGSSSSSSKRGSSNEDISQVLEKQKLLIGGLREEFSEKLASQRRLLAKMAQETKWIEDEGIRLRVEHEESTGDDVRRVRVEFKDEFDKIDRKIEVMNERQKDFFAQINKGFDRTQRGTFSKLGNIESTLSNVEEQIMMKRKKKKGGLGSVTFGGRGGAATGRGGVGGGERVGAKEKVPEKGRSRISNLKDEFTQYSSRAKRKKKVMRSRLGPNDFSVQQNEEEMDSEDDAIMEDEEVGVQQTPNAGYYKRPAMSQRRRPQRREFEPSRRLNYSTISHQGRKKKRKPGDVGRMGDRLSTLNKRINNLETFFQKDQEQSMKAIENLLIKSKIGN